MASPEVDEAKVNYGINENPIEQVVIGEEEVAAGNVDINAISLDRAFRKYDQDGSGSISIQELGNLCEELGQELNERELHEAMGQLDADASGLVDRQEFEAWWSGRNDGCYNNSLRRLAERGRRENHVDIFSASWKGDLEMVQEFVAIDPTQASKCDETEFGEGHTALHYASYAGHLDVVEYLLSLSKVNANAQNWTGCTPLFQASQQGHIDVVRVLLAKGARVNMAEFKTGLCAIQVADNEKVKEVLLQGCDTTVPRKVVRSPCVTCPKFGTLEVEWSTKGVEHGKGRSLAVSGYIIRIMRAEEEGISSSSSAASSDEEEEKGNSIERGSVLLEVQTSGGGTSCQIISGLKYPFHVQVCIAAFNVAGTGEFSDLSEPMMCTSVPSVISAPSAVTAGVAAVKVTWKKAVSNGNRILGYKLEASEHGDDEWVSMGMYPPGCLESIVKSLKPGTTYLFRIVCSNKLGKSKPGPVSLPVTTAGGARRSSRKKV